MPLPPEAGRDADLVDIEFGRLVGMAMHDGRGLPDHDAVMDRHDHVVAGLGEIRGEPHRIDRLVEHVFGDAVEHGRIGWRQLPELDFRHG